MKNYFLLFLLIPFLLVSCKDQEDKDDDLILAYIADNGLEAISAEEGLYYVVDSLGTGVSPDLSSEINIAYAGFLLDGTGFDSSSDFTFPLSGLIRGWQLGIPHFKVGGAGTLLIPSHLGYGSNQVGSIPANSVLVFDIHLIGVI